MTTCLFKLLFSRSPIVHLKKNYIQLEHPMPFCRFTDQNTVDYNISKQYLLQFSFLLSSSFSQRILYKIISGMFTQRLKMYLILMQFGKQYLAVTCKCPSQQEKIIVVIICQGGDGTRKLKIPAPQHRIRCERQRRRKK